VLAFAYAAARPPRGFWDKVLKEAEKLEADGKITPRDHQLLRSNFSIQQELTKLTLGDEEALTEEKITTTIARVSNEIRREAMEERDLIKNELEEANNTISSLSINFKNVQQKFTGNAKQRPTAKQVSCPFQYGPAN
jgi:leucyl aminopeptidase